MLDNNGFHTVAALTNRVLDASSSTDPAKSSCRLCMKSSSLENRIRSPLSRFRRWVIKFVMLDLQ